MLSCIIIRMPSICILKFKPQPTTVYTMGWTTHAVLYKYNASVPSIFMASWFGRYRLSHGQFSAFCLFQGRWKYYQISTSLHVKQKYMGILTYTHHQLFRLCRHWNGPGCCQTQCIVRWGMWLSPWECWNSLVWWSPQYHCIECRRIMKSGIHKI